VCYVFIIDNLVFNYMKKKKELVILDKIKDERILDITKSAQKMAQQAYASYSAYINNPIYKQASEEVMKIKSQIESIVGPINEKMQMLKPDLEKIQNIVANYNESITKRQDLDLQFYIPQEKQPIDEEIMRQAIKDELIVFKEEFFKREKAIKNDSQIIIKINSKNELSVGGNKSKFTLHHGGVVLLRALSENTGYVCTPEIVDSTDIYNTNDSVRKAIAKINSKMRVGLGLKEKVILGRRNLGYMINNLYRIEFIK